jgi:hypothetical protein
MMLSHRWRNRAYLSTLAGNFVPPNTLNKKQANLGQLLPWINSLQIAPTLVSEESPKVPPTATVKKSDETGFLLAGSTRSLKGPGCNDIGGHARKLASTLGFVMQ